MDGQRPGELGAEGCDLVYISRSLPVRLAGSGPFTENHVSEIKVEVEIGQEGSHVHIVPIRCCLKYSYISTENTITLRKSVLDFMRRMVLT
jgi:hypothetical protein